MPYSSFTRTAVCPEGYFLKGMPHTFERNTVYTCTITNIFKYSIIQWIFHVFKMMLCISTWFFGASYFMRSTCLSLQNVPYLFMMQSLLCQEDAALLGDKMKSPVNQKCCFLLFMLAKKTCSIEANTTLSFERGATGQN